MEPARSELDRRQERALILPALVLLSMATSPPFEGASRLEHDQICLWTGTSGDTRRVHAEVWLDAKPQAVIAALTDWARLGELLPGTKTFEVREQGQRKARLYRVQDTPLLFPDVWVEADATVVSSEDVTRVRLSRRDGNAKVFLIEWEVRASSSNGTALRYRSEAQPPFSPPRFLFDRVQLKQVPDHVERLRARLGAKVTQRAARCD